MDQTDKALREAAINVSRVELSEEIKKFMSAYANVFNAAGFTNVEAFMAFQLMQIKEGIQGLKEILEEIYPSEEKNA